MSLSKITIYRAGTEERRPSFDAKCVNEVWLVTNLALYYPLDQDQTQKPRTKAKAGAITRLWECVIQPTSVILVEKHPTFEGICVAKLRTRSPRRAESTEQLQKILESLDWDKSKVPPGCRGGMSMIHFNTLVQAVIDYMKENYPTTPEEFNFQAELKAASHWRWFGGKEPPPQPIAGPHDDFRIQMAATKALKKWKDDLAEAKAEQISTDVKPSHSGKAQSDDEDSDCVEEYISGLEEDIFDLTMYYGKYLKEINVDEATSTDCGQKTEETCYPEKKKFNTRERKRPRTLNDYTNSKAPRYGHVGREFSANHGLQLVSVETAI